MDTHASDRRRHRPAQNDPQQSTTEGTAASRAWVEWARPSEVAMRMGASLARSGVDLDRRLRNALTEQRLAVTDQVRHTLHQRRRTVNADTPIGLEVGHGADRTVQR